MHYRLVMMRFTLGFVRRNRSIASRYRYPTGTYPTPTHHQHKQALSLLQPASAAAAVGCRVRMYQSINFAAKSSCSCKFRMVQCPGAHNSWSVHCNCLFGSSTRSPNTNQHDGSKTASWLPAFMLQNQTSNRRCRSVIQQGTPATNADPQQLAPVASRHIH